MLAGSVDPDRARLDPRIIRIAVFRSRVQTAAVRPNSVPFASAIACASVDQRNAQRIGPKTSSRATRIDGSTSA